MTEDAKLKKNPLSCFHLSKNSLYADVCVFYVQHFSLLHYLFCRYLLPKAMAVQSMKGRKYYNIL